MSITIHYSGKLDDPRILPDLLLAAKHFCFQHHWEYTEVDDRIIGRVERWTTHTIKNEELSNDEMDWSDTTLRTRLTTIREGLFITHVFKQMVEAHPELI